MGEPIELLTAKETWRALKICERTLRDLTNSGEIPHLRLGKRNALRYDVADVRAFIERKKSRHKSCAPGTNGGKLPAGNRSLTKWHAC